MRIPFMAALLAASAFIPSVASAQDSDRGDRRPEGRAHGEARQRGPERGQNPAPQAAAQAPAQPQARPQAQTQQVRGDRGQPRQGDRAGNFYGNRSAPQAQGQAQAQGQGQGQPQFQRGDGGRPGVRLDRDGGQGFRASNGDGRPDYNRGPQGRPGGDNRGPDPRQNYNAGNRNNGGAAYWQQQGRNGNDWRNHGRGQQAFDNRGAWNRGWRNDNRYDWNRYRSVNRGVFQLPRYYAPSGWGYGYRRFSVGITLNAILFNQNYWIDDPEYYRLPPVYGPYRWVRYYNDALLVDIRSGYVVDTIYDIFW